MGKSTNYTMNRYKRTDVYVQGILCQGIVYTYNLNSSVIHPLVSCCSGLATTQKTIREFMAFRSSHWTNFKKAGNPRRMLNNARVFCTAFGAILVSTMTTIP